MEVTNAFFVVNENLGMKVDESRSKKCSDILKEVLTGTLSKTSYTLLDTTIVPFRIVPLIWWWRAVASSATSVEPAESTRKPCLITSATYLKTVACCYVSSYFIIG